MNIKADMYITTGKEHREIPIDKHKTITEKTGSLNALPFTKRTKAVDIVDLFPKLL